MTDFGSFKTIFVHLNVKDSTAQIIFFVGILLRATAKLTPLDNRDVSSEERRCDDRFITDFGLFK